MVFPVQSAWGMLTAIGMRDKERRVAVHRMGEPTERTSYLLWNKRKELSRTPGDYEQ